MSHSHSFDTNESQPEKPVPGLPRSPRHNAQTQVQNRRREYLVQHVSYFDNLEHEIADPVLYERLVKRFQTPSERQAEGKAKGYGRTLEAAMMRGEAKLANLKHRNGDANGVDTDLEPAWEPEPSTKEEGLQLWHEFLEERFIRGRDEGFDYAVVDSNEDLDAMARKDAEDAWFDEEEPSWVADSPEPSGGNAPRRAGETGVQDF